MLQITSVIWVQINLVFSFPQPGRLFDMLLLGKSNLSFQFRSVTSVVKIKENNFSFLLDIILYSAVINCSYLLCSRSDLLVFLSRLLILKCLLSLR